MSDTLSRYERIKTAIERKVDAIRARPYVANGTARTKVVLKEGFQCVVEDGPWSFAVDMGNTAGGDDTGPNPGVYARGALGSCLAIGYQMWAARLGIVLDRLEVDIHADYDARGEYAVADIDPGYSEVRYVVRIDTQASDVDVNRLIEAADSHSSILDVFARGIRVMRTVEITQDAD